jgi:hypothetical protein
MPAPEHDHPVSPVLSARPPLVPYCLSLANYTDLPSQGYIQDGSHAEEAGGERWQCSPRHPSRIVRRFWWCAIRVSNPTYSTSL